MITLVIKSRLRLRRPTKTVSVKTKTLASGQHTESNVYIDLKPTHEQVDAFETTTDGGAIVVVSDVFWFESIAGEGLPVIEEKHVLVDEKSVRYEVVMVQNQAGGNSRLKVMCRRLR